MHPPSVKTLSVHLFLVKVCSEPSASVETVPVSYRNEITWLYLKVRYPVMLVHVSNRLYEC